MNSAPDETPQGSGSSGTTGAPGTTGTTGTAGTTGTEESARPPTAPPGPGGEQRLHRGGRGRMLAGVAVGLADYFDVDPTLVRIGFVALAFLGGLAVPLYVAGWLLIPDEASDVSVAEELFARERARSAY
jgi:phage shock protein PspC (stress-responsive transcriptional regulator)